MGLTNRRGADMNRWDRAWVSSLTATLKDFTEDDSAPAPYTSGTWGPAASSALIGRDGLQWREEVLPED